jgi:triacylglycerol lipase
MDHGWKNKRLHRLIVTSAAYRQSSVNTAAQRKDPDNRLLGRFRIRRLDAESVRDSLLAVSGRLDVSRFGPPVPIAVNAQGQFVVGRQKRDGNGDAVGVEVGGTADFRRSLYVTVRRTMPVGVLETFDAPVVNPNCEARPVSTAAPQSLMFLNDGFVLDRSLDLAQRLDEAIASAFGPEQPIDLLGFSMGGVIARSWIQLLGGAPRTRRFISVASPHRGTLAALPWPRTWLAGVADMKPGSSLLERLNADLDPLRRIDCCSFYCPTDLTVFPGWLGVLPVGRRQLLPVLRHDQLLMAPQALQLLLAELLRP